MATSGESGNFVIEDVPEGEQTLVVQKSFDDSSFTTLERSIQVYGDLNLEAILLPEPVHLFKTAAESRSSISMAWNVSTNSGFREYKLFRHVTSGLDENSGQLVHVSTNANDTTFVDSTIAPGMVFYYRLYVMNEFGKMGGSNIISGTTQAMVSFGQYSLVKRTSIGVPLSNPVGITSDGENLWVVFGDHNGAIHHIICYDPTSGTILKKFSFENLIEQAGTGVYGITWDGSALWISVAGNVNKVVKVSPEDGTLLQTWSSPTVLGPSDLSWDGNLLWISDGTGTVFTMNPANGGSELFVDLPIERDYGCELRENELWIGDMFSTDLHIINTSTGKITAYLNKALAYSGCFCFHKGELTVVSNSGIIFYTITEQ